MIVLFSYLADLVFGDPEGLPHPVRGIGKLISLLERRLMKDSSESYQLINGIILALSVTGISGMAGYLFIEITGRINDHLGLLASIYLGYTTISITDLRMKAKGIWDAIDNYDLPRAGYELSKIVGRDTHNLGKKDIIKASLESIAESTNDGIVAPLFYLTLGGPILAIIYKAINTLDSMVGYKNKKYLYFGWASAKLDDMANFIPARISGFLIALACPLAGGSFRKSFKAMISFAGRHPSANSGFPEAAMAGALDITLGGPRSYQGEVIHVANIGDGRREIEPFLMRKAVYITYTVSLIAVSMGVIIRWAMWRCL